MILRATFIRVAFLTSLAISTFGHAAETDDLKLTLRYQQETSLHSTRFHQLERAESWKPEETAIIVCDVWDYHHCLNAVRRIEEFAPRLNKMITAARNQGVTIIHAPSDCMPAYENHPARTRAIRAETPERVPFDCKAWCSKIPSEERAVYPIDQSDGGEDDAPSEHAEWAEKLKAMGRNPGMPWMKQTDLIEIDADRDFISDRGDEVWNVLQQQGIRNVILTGVHTNMCVLGRPFGLRQMVRNGKNVVLMRDMTDTMYNPQRWPFVSHFTGTDLIIDHIERYVCPTISSDQLIGGNEFRFRNDQRPHLVMLIAEDEYGTKDTLPRFAAEKLGRDFRVTLVHGSDRERNSLPGIEVVQNADVLLVSVRRRVLPNDELKLIRDFVAAGKPVVGIRTASHAFALRNQDPPEGYEDWPEFDAEVFGGNYHGHYGNQLKSLVNSVEAPPHDVLDNVSRNPIKQGGSLYKTSPLASGTTVLSTGIIEGEKPEPVTWTFERADGGRSFYTSMGHVKDFENPVFVKTLYQGLCWAADIKPTIPLAAEHWKTTSLPLTGDATDASSVMWLRCAFRLPPNWADADASLTLASASQASVWVNGKPLQPNDDGQTFRIPVDLRYADDANLLAIRLAPSDIRALSEAPTIRLDDGNRTEVLTLAGRWQTRDGDSESYSNIPLPAKFGASADIVFTLDEPLWVARPVTKPGEFTAGIEGPACDADGNIFAVNFLEQGTIGRISPQGSGEVFVKLPEGSIGNGIRFDKDGNFFVADYPQHNVLKVDLQTRNVSIFASNSNMNQPNDLAIAPDGTLYASDPNWKNGTGQLWRIDADGTTTRLASDMGTTNGIDVSPDGTRLYVNESKQRNIWIFDIAPDQSLTNKRLLKQFPDHGFDGMRCDIDGNLYVSRYGKGTVVKLSPGGKILREIDVLGSRPSNVCFGGDDGRTVYVTEVDFTRLVSFRVDRPGRDWQSK